ncbi:2Fe-2S iron-sulfur cluster-binding protein [Streptomyces sp. NPDC003635]
MTDDQHGEGAPQGGGRWDPLPQGDYDDGATAFVKLPEGGVDALLASSDSPLAAPGHGYVPPPITVTPGTTAGTDPAATGTWAMPAGGVQWPDANAGTEEAGNDRFTYNPAATGQWNFEDAGAADSAPGHDVTGQWSIPVADGDLPDESGEFTTSSLVEQWGGTPPATLPGGAPAPWATQPPPQSIGEPWSQPAPEQAEPAPEQADRAAEHGAPHAHLPVDADTAVPRPPAPEPVAEAAEPAPEASEAAVEAREPEGAAEGPQEADSGAESAVEPPTDQPSPPGEEHPLASYVLRVNGVDRPVTDAWIGESLLYVLRERLGLAGAKDGCSQGECGACNVQVDGRLVASCLVPAVTAASSEVRTVEGLAVDGHPSDVQRALARCGAVQCGFCVPGMAMTVHDLLEGNPAPTELETRQALCGNLCRCSGYRGVVEAVKEVVAEREAHSAADGEPDPDEARIPHQAGPGAGGVHPSALDPHDQAYGQDGGQA